MAEVFNYKIFGLRVRSEIPLPELFPAANDGEPNIIVSAGPVPEGEGVKGGLNAVDGALVLVIPDVARFRIEQGNRITVDAGEDVSDRNVRLYLLGSAFGALLHQRGLLPLHANAIEIEGQAVAFMGESGAGKSTLAAWFHQQGFRVIADDVCVVGLDVECHPYAAPGLPRLRLWREALDLMGRDPSGCGRSYLDPAQEFDKFDIPIAHNSVAHSNVPLRLLYLLDRADDFSVTRINGLDAAEAIFSNIYRGSYIAAAGNQRDHWQIAIELVRRVPVYRVAREWGLGKLGDQYRQLLDCIAAQVDCSTDPVGQTL